MVAFFLFQQRLLESPSSFSYLYYYNIDVYCSESPTSGTTASENTQIEVLCFSEKIRHSELPENVKRYFTYALNHVPAFFIVSKLYNELKHFEQPLCLFDSDSGVPVQIFGPKGVGKSTCLYALALQMTISAKTQDDLIILYFTEDSDTDGLQTVNSYLQSSGLDCTFDTLAQTIINYQQRKIVICLDYGKYNNGRLKQFVHLFNSMSPHIRMIVAHSSGRGYYAVKSLWQTFQRLRIISKIIVTGRNFNDIEARKFQEIYKLQNVPFEYIKKNTNLNPLLLQEMVGAHNGSWKHEYDAVYEASVGSEISRTIERLTADTFSPLDRHSGLKEFAQRLKKTDFFLYYARTGLEVKICYLMDFRSSWVCEEGHCYIVQMEKENFVIAMNFPNADKIISSKISQMLSAIDNKDDTDLDTGGFLGYQFERKFYHACLETQQFPIMLESNKTVTIKMEFCTTANIEDKLNNGVLYKLYSSHPAVDFVGELQVENDTYLTFFQLSVSSYLNHQSKVWHLLEKYDNFENFKNQSVLDYYKSLSKATEVLFVYISPKEAGVPSSLKKHVTNYKMEIKLGSICLDTYNSLTTVIRQFRRIEYD